MSSSTDLSPIHAMLKQIEPQKDAARLNAIVNHPDIYPWVKGFADGPLDLSPVIDGGEAVCLLGEHGGLLFHRLQPGLYEVHTQVVPEGRGEWALNCARACLHWLFTRTDAVEVLTKCPEGNLAAKSLARACGLTKEFTNPVGWVLDGKPVPADIYSITIQTWMRTASGLAERGAWFHRRLEAEFERLNVRDLSHMDDATHDRYVGAACEMILGGQPDKAAVFYNRWAALATYAPIAIASYEPMAVNIGNALVLVCDGDISVATIYPMH